ncbi:hypothetical protein CsSME_00023388 [Camellia sinensis var. sinensis]
MISDEKRKMSTSHRPVIMLPTSTYTVHHMIVFISLFLLLSPAGAQSGTNDGAPQDNTLQNFSPSMSIIIVILVGALFFMGFFSVYIRHCAEPSPSGSVGAGLRRSLRRRTATRGLDPAVIDTFPTFMYSVVKGLKIGKGALECAVCLNEFEDEENLRLIPKCDHVFHPECIDAWLNAHVTCPVCRTDLVPQPGETLQSPDFNLQIDDSEETQNPQNPADEVSIRVVEDPEEDSLPPPPPPPQVLDRTQNQSFNQNRPPRSGSVRSRLFGRFPRSHSTGHSLVQPGENTDRFTLRLPEDVRKKVMSRALNRTTSLLVLPGEGSSRRGYRAGIGEGSSRGIGDGSSRGRRSYRRLDRTIMSDRWVFSMAPPFFTRTSSSLKSPKVKAADGEGSTSSTATTPRGRAAMKLPSFKCMEPKAGDETGLVSTGSDRPQI